MKKIKRTQSTLTGHFRSGLEILRNNYHGPKDPFFPKPAKKESQFGKYFGENGVEKVGTGTLVIRPVHWTIEGPQRMLTGPSLVMWVASHFSEFSVFT